jgi:hypothetical protein
MKTHQELNSLADHLYSLMEGGPNDVAHAIKILDDLHSEGMQDAAGIATHIAKLYDDMPSTCIAMSKIPAAIRSAINSKPKP